GEVTDEHSPLPRRTLDIYGLEAWGTFKSGISWRVHAEYADTACFDGTSPTDQRLFDCAYNQHIFDVEGYRYRGRVMGHSIDADGISYALGTQVNTPGMVSGWLLMRYAELNRGGVIPDTNNTVAQEPVDEWELETGATIRAAYGDFKVGLGFDQQTDQIT